MMLVLIMAAIYIHTYVVYGVVFESYTKVHKTVAEMLKRNTRKNYKTIDTQGIF